MSEMVTGKTEAMASRRLIALCDAVRILHSDLPKSDSDRQVADDWFLGARVVRRFLEADEIELAVLTLQGLVASVKDHPTKYEMSLVKRANNLLRPLERRLQQAAAPSTQSLATGGGQST